jgi:hypothetical protein
MAAILNVTVFDPQELTLNRTETTAKVGTQTFSFRVHIYSNVLYIFTKYLWYIPTYIGLSGNAMSIMVALQRNNRKLSTSVYIVALASADSLTLAENNWAYNVIFGYYNIVPSEFHLQ